MKIKQMEASGVFDKAQIDEAKVSLGLSTDAASRGTTDQSYNLIMMDLTNEQDPDRRQQLLQTLAMSESMKKGGMDSATMMMMMNQNRAPAAKQASFQDKMMEKFMDKMMKEPESELQNLGKLKDLIQGVQSIVPESNPLQEIKANLEIYKTLGLVQDPSHSIEEKKLDLEKLKMEKTLELEEKKIENEAERTKSLGNVAGDVLGSLFSAIGQAKEGTGSKAPAGPSQEFVANSLEAKCISENCGGKILITNSKESRNISCPKCSQKYEYKSDTSQLFLIQEQ